MSLNKQIRCGSEETRTPNIGLEILGYILLTTEPEATLLMGQDGCGQKRVVKTAHIHSAYQLCV